MAPQPQPRRLASRSDGGTSSSAAVAHGGPATHPHLTCLGRAKDAVYEALDEALASQNVQSAMEVGAELASTQGEGSTLVTHLVAAYATWYHGTDGPTTMRACSVVEGIVTACSPNNNSVVKGSCLSALNRVAHEPAGRRALCALLALLSLAPRRRSPHQLPPLPRTRTRAANASASASASKLEHLVASLALTLEAARSSPSPSNNSSSSSAERTASAERASQASQLIYDVMTESDCNAQCTASVWNLVQTQSLVQQDGGVHADGRRRDVRLYVDACSRLSRLGLQNKKYRQRRIGLLIGAARAVAAGRLSSLRATSMTPDFTAELDRINNVIESAPAIDQLFTQCLECLKKAAAEPEAETEVEEWDISSDGNDYDRPLVTADRGGDARIGGRCPDQEHDQNQDPEDPDAEDDPLSFSENPDVAHLDIETASPARRRAPCRSRVGQARSGRRGRRSQDNRDSSGSSGVADLRQLPLYMRFYSLSNGPLMLEVAQERQQQQQHNVGSHARSGSDSGSGTTASSAQKEVVVYR